MNQRLETFAHISGTFKYPDVICMRVWWRIYLLVSMVAQVVSS